MNSAAVPSLILWGMPGAGKTTLGQGLALQMQRPFYDLDRLIQKQTGKQTAEIFDELGEPAFRALERDALGQVLRMPRPFVLALGGGTLTNPGFAEQLLQEGYTIWLDPPLSELEARLAQATGERPLFVGLTPEERSKRIAQLYAARKAEYAKATLHINRVTNAEKVLRLLRKEFAQRD
jgi:shikimate kinase